MEDCPFCKIGRKEIPVKAVAANDSALAFLDINPVSPGHTVVIPKKHAATVLDMDDDAIASLFSLVRQATLQVKNGLNCDGFNIGLNHGRAAGQAIPHMHIHIIPRFNGDGGGSMHSIVRNPPKESIDQIYAKVREAVAQEEKYEVAYEKTEEKSPEKPKDTRKIPRDWELDL